MKIKDPFLRTMFYTCSGATLGLFAGLVLGLVIYIIGSNLSLFPYQGDEEIYAIAPFFGMGFGCIIGSIFGGGAANSKKK